MLQSLYINLGIGKTMLNILNKSDYKTKRSYVQSGKHHETTDAHTHIYLIDYLRTEGSCWKETPWMLHLKQVDENIFGKYLMFGTHQD